MTQLLEIKDRLVRFYGKYETYLFMVVKFAVALTALLVINFNIGYMSKISSVPVALILALVCALLPINGTLFICAVVILLDMYALSLEAALITLALFVILYLLYFRFSPKDGIGVLLTPVCFKIGIPYILPVGMALLRPAYSVISIICGTVLYYYLDGIRLVSASLTVEDSGDVSKINIILGQLTNKELYLVVGIFVLSFLIVYFVRKMEIERAWTIALIAGTLVELAGIFAGYLIMNISGKSLRLLIGGVISLLLGFLIEFLFMNLDYARTERAQFEDDEYYYYVKAVPKKMVPSKEKTVKHFGNTGSMGKRIRPRSSQAEQEEATSRKMIAQELDIDEDMLK